MNGRNNRATTGDSAVWLELVGSKQGWLERCRRAVSGDPVALAELKDDNSAAAEALSAADTRTAPQAGDLLLAPVGGYDWYVAQVIRGVALALAEPDLYNRQASLQALDGYIKHARLASAEPNSAHAISSPVDLPDTSTSGFVAAEDEVGDRVPLDAGTFAELLSAELRMQFPSTIDSVTVPVLFAGDTARLTGQNLSGAGATGKLTIERLAGGPPGLHADPRSMCFLRADDAFSTSIQRAWASAAPRLKLVCLVWSLRMGTDAAQPLTDIDGGSLGGAFAVALDSLSTSTRVRWLVRPRSLDPRCVVTAALKDELGTLSGVSGLDQKVTAAITSGLRLIVAAPDLTPAQQTPHNDQAHILGAVDIQRASRLARGHFNRRFRSLVAATLALTILLTGFAVVLGVNKHRETVARLAAVSEQQKREQRQRETDQIIRSEVLANRSGELLTTDSDLAGLAGLAAFQTSPTPQSVKAMSAAINRNPQRARAVTLPPGPYDPYSSVPSAAFNSSVAWIGKNQQILTYTLDTGMPLADPVVTIDSFGSDTHGLVLNEQSDRLVAIMSEHITAYVVDDRHRLDEIFTRPIPANISSDFPPSVVFSPDGRRLLLLGSEGNGRVWNVDDATSDGLEIDLDQSVSEVDHPYISSVKSVPQGDGWVVQMTLSDLNDETSTMLISWAVDRQRALLLTERTDLQMEDAQVLSPSLTVGRDGGRGLVLWADGLWKHIANVANERINEIAAVDSRRVVINHGDTITLMDVITGQTYPLYNGLQNPPLYELVRIDTGRFVAVDTGGRVVVADTAAVRNELLSASVYDLGRDGTSAESEPGSAIEVRQYASPPAAEPRSVIQTYRRPVPEKFPTQRYDYLPYALATTANYVATVGAMVDPDGGESSKNLVTTWNTSSESPIIEDTCGPGQGDNVIARVTLDNQLLLVGGGSTICRWKLPSGERLKDTDLSKLARGDEGIPNIVDLIEGGKSALILTTALDSVYQTARLLDVTTGILREVKGGVIDAAMSSDGVALALVDVSGQVSIFDTATMTAIGSFTVQKGASKLAYSPDGATLAVWSLENQALRFVDAVTGVDQGPARVDPQDGLRNFYLFHLRWVTDDSLVLDFGGRDGYRPQNEEDAQDEEDTETAGRGRFELADLSGQPTWKQEICATAPKLDETAWSEEIGADVPSVDPCS